MVRLARVSARFADQPLMPPAFGTWEARAAGRWLERGKSAAEDCWAAPAMAPARQASPAAHRALLRGERTAVLRPAERQAGWLWPRRRAPDEPPRRGGGRA